MAIVGKFNQRTETMAQKNWKKLFTDLSNYLFTKNNWDLARYIFLTFKNHLKPTHCNNEIIYDCFLSEYDSFSSMYSEIQKHIWSKRCSDDNCQLTGKKSGKSSYFSLK